MLLCSHRLPLPRNLPSVMGCYAPRCLLRRRVLGPTTLCREPAEPWEGSSSMPGSDMLQDGEPTQPVLLSWDPAAPLPWLPAMPGAGSLHAAFPFPLLLQLNLHLTPHSHGLGAYCILPGDNRTHNTDAFGA